MKKTTHDFSVDDLGFIQPDRDQRLKGDEDD